MSSFDVRQLDSLPTGALLRFALLAMRSRIYEGVVDAGFVDLRPAQVTLFRWPGPAGKRPTEIADYMGLSKQTINDLLRDLEARGYVTRHRDSQDERARIIQLTRRGEQLRQTAVAMQSRTEQEWAHALGVEQFQTLRQLLSRVIQLAEDLNQRQETDEI
jgi:DNA-binding MarR family transcriptional regulator